MRKSRVIAKWRSGNPVLGTTLHIADPAVFEMVSLLGFDLIWIDLEHRSNSVKVAAELMRAARVGHSDIIARPAKGEFMRMARLLEAGAQGIMYPRCASAEEAMAVVRNCKFPPFGDRGLDAAGPDAAYGMAGLQPYLQHAQAETFIAIQIEDDEGLSNAEAIAAVEGVDLLFFGPGDYSLRAGFPGNFDDPRYWEAIDKVASAAKSAGKLWGTPAISPDHCTKLLDAGAMLVTRTGDMTLLRMAYTNLKETFSPLGFTFGTDF